MISVRREELVAKGLVDAYYFEALAVALDTVAQRGDFLR